jgi:hypothetical protein
VLIIGRSCLVGLSGPLIFYRIQKATLDTDGWAWPSTEKPAAGCSFGVAGGLLGQLRGSRVFLYRTQKATLDPDGWAWPSAERGETCSWVVFWRGEAGLAGPSARLQNLSLQDSECNVDID